MKKKIALLLGLVLILSIFAVGCSQPKETQGEQASEESDSSGEAQFITILTGGSSGPYFALGGAVSNLFNEHISGANTSVESTAASVVNATKIGEGKAELAFAMNDVVSQAYEGIETFADKGKVENLRGVASLYPNFVQVFTLEDSGISEIADLKGKRVGVGAPASGTEVNARQILAAHDITYDDIQPDYLSYAESVEQMKNGTVDAAFITSGLPNATIMDLAATHDMKIVPIRSEAVEKLTAEYPFYSANKIPGGMYDDEEDVETAAVTTILITREDLSEDLVYNMTKTIFDNLDILKQTHSAANDISLDSVKQGMPIPLHSGAEKYFEEVGK